MQNPVILIGIWNFAQVQKILHHVKKCSCKFAAKTNKKLLGLKSDVYGIAALLFALSNKPARISLAL